VNNFYRRTELIITILLIAGFIFLAAQGLKKPAKAIKDQIHSVIAGLDLDNLQSLNKIYELAELGEEAIPELQEIIEQGSISEKGLAIIALSSFLEEKPDLKNNILPILKQALVDENDDVKMLAAGQLISFGEKDSFPVLISLLEVEKTTIFSESAKPIKEQSLEYLQKFTNYDGQTPQEWQNWWEENQDSLFWNEKQEIFQIKEE